MALGGAYQVWFAFREQRDPEWGRRPAARRRFALPPEI